MKHGSPGSHGSHGSPGSHGSWLLLGALGVGLCGSFAEADGPATPPKKAPKKAPKTTYLTDAFSGKQLSKQRWKPVRAHDTKSDRIAVEQGALVIALNTLKTDDRTVKLRGVASRQVFGVPAEDPPLRISVVLDWNNQRNGSYLTAGFALQPVLKGAGEKKGAAKQKGKPKATAAWVPHRAQEALAFEVVGVPPARNARPFLWRRTAGGLRPLYTEGWPQPKRKDRVGRRIGRSTWVLAVTQRRLQLYENGKQLHDGPCGFSGRFRVQLFVTGHSNYPERSVKFDDVKVERPLLR